MDDINPLEKVVFVQRVAAFACQRTPVLIKLSHINSSFQDMVHNFARHIFKNLIHHDNYFQGQLLLFRAVSADALWLVDALVHFWVMGRFPNVLWEEIPFFETTPMSWACKHGQHDMVQLLLDHNFPTRVYDRSGNNALHHACRNGHREVVRTILKDPNTKAAQVNSLEDTCLAIAARYGHSGVVEEILLSNAETGAQQGSSRNKKVDVTSTNELGVTALHLACMNGHSDVVKQLLLLSSAPASDQKMRDLLRHKCSDEKHGRGFEPIHFAVVFGRHNVVKVLLDHEREQEQQQEQKTSSDPVAKSIVFSKDALNRTPLGLVSAFWKFIPDSDKIVIALLDHLHQQYYHHDHHTTLPSLLLLDTSPYRDAFCDDGCVFAVGGASSSSSSIHDVEVDDYGYINELRAFGPQQERRPGGQTTTARHHEKLDLKLSPLHMACCNISRSVQQGIAAEVQSSEQDEYSSGIVTRLGRTLSEFVSAHVMDATNNIVVKAHGQTNNDDDDDDDGDGDDVNNSNHSPVAAKVGGGNDWRFLRSNHANFFDRRHPSDKELFAEIRNTSSSGDFPPLLLLRFCTQIQFIRAIIDSRCFGDGLIDLKSAPTLKRTALHYVAAGVVSFVLEQQEKQNQKHHHQQQKQHDGSAFVQIAQELLAKRSQELKNVRDGHHFSALDIISLFHQQHHEMAGSDGASAKPSLVDVLMKQLQDLLT